MRPTLHCSFKLACLKAKACGEEKKQTLKCSSRTKGNYTIAWIGSSLAISKAGKSSLIQIHKEKLDCPRLQPLDKSDIYMYFRGEWKKGDVFNLVEQMEIYCRKTAVFRMLVFLGKNCSDFNEILIIDSISIFVFPPEFRCGKFCFTGSLQSMSSHP